MKFFQISFLTLASFWGSAALSEEQYTNAYVERVEVCTNSNGYIFVFLKDATGNPPSTGDGCSNDKRMPEIRIAIDEPTEIQKSMLSLVMIAYTTGKQIRVRYDNTNSAAISIALL